MSWLRKGLVIFGAGFPFFFLAAFALEPVVQQGIGSFFTWYDMRPSTFAGFRNFAPVFANPMARAALLHTVVYVILTVPLEVGLGLAGAWLAIRLRRGKAVFVAFWVLPLVIPWSSAATAFLGFFNNGGILDWFGSHLLGVHQPVLWLQGSKTAFALIVVAGIWKGTPWCFLLLLAALGACPSDIFEAARVDGARGLSFWSHVVMPEIRPMLVFVTAFRIFAEGQASTSVALLTGGGPFNATVLASNYDNTLAFQDFQLAGASAFSTVTGVALLILAVAGFASLYLLTSGRWRGAPGARLLALARQVHGLARTPRRRRSTSINPMGSRGRRLSSSSMRAERRLAAGLAALIVVAVLLPMAGGLAGGGLFPEFSQPWSLISSGLENSAVLTLATVLGTLVLASPAAYALARGRWRLRPALFALVLVAMAVPGALLILPQYKEIFWLGLLNTRAGLVLLYVAIDLPLAVLFMRAAFASVPDQLVESMRVDGAPALRIFTRLFLPLSASTIITVVVFVVIQVWNEQLLAGALLDTSSLYPFPVLVALDVGGTASLSASWISLAPPLFVFVVFQRWFQRGMLPGPLI